MSAAETLAPETPTPRANPELLGHEDAERELRAAATSGRLHHAWLISGPRGIGKATLAYRFARWLLAGGADDAGQGGLFADTPAAGGLAIDPTDPVFQRVAAGAHPDLATVERGLDDSGKRLRTRIVIGDVRKATRFLTLTAAEGGWRVVIVDGAEEMNVNAANALLKTLEEPPPRTVLLLVSHAPGRLAATIRSRCRKLSLAPLGDDTVAALIARYRPELDANEARALAIIAEGSAGRALTLAASGGIALYNDMLALLASLPELDIPRLHGTAERIARARAEDGPMAAFDVFTDLLLWWIARLVASRARGSEAPEVVPGEAAVMARLAGLQGLDRWGEVWENLSHFVDRAVRLNLDRKQVLLDAFFTLARVGP